MKRIWWLRVISLVVLFAISAHPVVTRPEAGIPPNWAVLLDASESMRVKDPTSRFDRAKATAVEIADRFPSSHLHEFSDQIRPVTLEELEQTKPEGKKTDLSQALKSVFNQTSWRGVVVLTDGRQVGGGDVLSAAASIGRPLIIVGYGDRALFKDIAVRSIQSPPFAFKNLPSSLSATLSMMGYNGRQITVKLKDGEKLLSLQTIQAGGDDVETTVNFQWTPASLGSKTLTVEVGAYAGEITTVNNRKDVTVDVGRDRFRVLYICGEPGPEYGFLRHQFKSDPGVELVTFVILRNAQNVVSVPENELSLIPFPTQDVLVNQMSSFDLVVFEEFPYWQYGLLPSVVLAIKQKVRDGGSFLIMGGPMAFGPGSGYAVPAIAEMIPVQVGSPEVATSPDPLPIHITAPSHPILRLEQNPESNLEIWKNLPPLDGVTLLPPAKAGSTVLATVRAGGQDHPVLTVWKVGKGRVAALSARTTWRWSMQKGAKEQSSDVYQQFWKNMVLWLTHSDEFKLVRMSMDNRVLALGDTEPMRIWVYDEYFKPISDADIRLQLTRPNGAKVSLVPRMEANGVHAVDIKGEELGSYEVEAWATRSDKKIGQEKMTFRVVEGYSEEEDLRPDFELLRELAHTSNGRFLRADEFSPRMLEEFNDELKKKGGQKILIWNSPWLLILLIGLLGAEWFLRKRRGLP